jgi:5'-3' exonuclease
MNDILIDGNSLWARCFYAVNEQAEEAKSVFIRMVLHLLDQSDGKFDVPIHRTLFCWDGKAKTNKNRKAKPHEYVTARYELQEALLDLFNTVHGYHPDFEADDIAATAVFNSTSEHVFLVSGDKDLMQLQGGPVAYYDLNSKSIVGSRLICRKFGVKHPSQVAIALAIIGDHGDGLTGIPRWGPKRTEKVFEAVTESMSFVEALAAVRRQIPREFQAIFMESLDATLLHTDVPGVPEPAELSFCGPGELRRIGIPRISQSYEHVASQYEGGQEALEEMLKHQRAAV